MPDYEPIMRDYHKDDLEMMEQAQVFHDNFAADQADFTAAFPKFLTPYETNFQTEIDTADAIPPDYTDGSHGLFEIMANAIYLYANFEDYGSDIPPNLAMVIAASGEQDYAYESSSGNGVMTGYLLESATRADRNRDGYITVSESYNYIYRNIDKNFNAVAWPFTDVFFAHVSGGPVDYILFTK